MSKPLTSSPRTEAAHWEKIIHPTGAMSRADAQRIISLDFSADERQRMRELAERNRAGSLAPGEEEELDTYCREGNTLSLLKSRSRAS